MQTKLKKAFALQRKYKLSGVLGMHNKLYLYSQKHNFCCISAVKEIQKYKNYISTDFYSDPSRRCLIWDQGQQKGSLQLCPNQDLGDHFLHLSKLFILFSFPHYITLHYITSHYITLHYIISHYITLHHITSRSGWPLSNFILLTKLLLFGFIFSQHFCVSFQFSRYITLLIQSRSGDHFLLTLLLDKNQQFSFYKTGLTFGMHLLWDSNSFKHCKEYKIAQTSQCEHLFGFRLFLLRHFVQKCKSNKVDHIRRSKSQSRKATKPQSQSNWPCPNSIYYKCFLFVFFTSAERSIHADVVKLDKLNSMKLKVVLFLQDWDQRHQHISSK